MQFAGNNFSSTRIAKSLRKSAWVSISKNTSKKKVIVAVCGIENIKQTV